METHSQLQPGQMLGSYRIVRKIGQGGMGEVYEAWDATLHRRVAIKILRHESLSDPDMGERLRGEGRALARLKHANVVSLYTLGEWQGRIYMALEYIDGVPLDHFLMSHACSLKDTLSLLRQMCEGLMAAHTAGIIHRDLKPANVVIDNTMRAKLVDFGIAKVEAERASGPHTSQNVVIGTVNYISPEMAVGKLASERSDIYSLGLVFFHMLSGMTPFIGRSNFETLEKIRTTALAFSPRLQLLISDEIKRVVLKMTAKAPGQRYASARDVLDDLDRINIDNLPLDLRKSTASGFPVANYTEVRKRCESLGFDACELRFVLTIAAGVQADALPPAKKEVTAKIDVRPLLEVSENSLNEGVRRFNQARSVMARRRQSETHAVLMPQPQPGADLGQSLLTAVCVMLIFASGFYFYRVGNARLHQFRVQQAQSAQSAVAPPTVASPAVAAPAVTPTAVVQPAVAPPAVVPPPMQERNMASEATAATKTYSLPRPQIGFLVTYSGIEGTVEWKVTDRREEYNVWESKSGEWEQRSLNPFLPSLRARVGTRESLNVISGSDPMALFPLQTGKKAVYRIEGQSASEKKSWAYGLSCEVGKEDKLTVPAGTFQVIQVECVTDAGERSLYAFAPLVGHWIRLEKNRRVMELSGYSLLVR